MSDYFEKMNKIRETKQHILEKEIDVLNKYVNDVVKSIGQCYNLLRDEISNGVLGGFHFAHLESHVKDLQKTFGKLHTKKSALRCLKRHREICGDFKEKKDNQE